jgi:hypothetical protein
VPSLHLSDALVSVRPTDPVDGLARQYGSLDLSFNVPVDASLFSTVVPPGYTMTTGDDD